MRRVSGLAMVALLALLYAGCAKKATTTPSGQMVTGPKAEAIDLLRESGNDLTELINAQDNSIPEWVIARAQCLIVIPHMVKGGFVVGAKHGRGAATCRQSSGRWTAPAFVKITGGSWGPQIGGEVADMVLAVMNREGMDALLNSNFQLGAHGAVTAGPAGREAGAEQGGVAQAGVLMYSRTKGLYAGATLEGAYIRPDDELNQVYFGRPLSAKVILSGEAEAPQSASLFLNAVQQADRQAAKAE